MEFEDLMKGLLERIGLKDCTPDENGAYYVLFDQMEVSILPMHEARKLTFYASLGEDETQRTNRLTNLLLQFNHLYEGGAGAVFSQDPKTKSFVLQQYESLSDLDVSLLADKLENFLTLLELWQGIIAKYDPQATPASEGDSLLASEQALVQGWVSA